MARNAHSVALASLLVLSCLAASAAAQRCKNLGSSCNSTNDCCQGKCN